GAIWGGETPREAGGGLAAGGFPPNATRRDHRQRNDGRRAYRRVHPRSCGRRCPGASAWHAVDHRHRKHRECARAPHGRRSHGGKRSGAMTARGLIVAAPNSGAGKTTVTLGILAALKRRGIAVRAAKAGPDYIDPAFHAAATGAQGFNLDTWAMPPALLDALVGETARHCELLVIEGVMGLFDG